MFNFYKKRRKPYNFGIVLSGGGARGFAHLGVLKALNQYNIFPDVISGVSAGSIVGAFYADGYSPDEIFELFTDSKIFNFLKLNIPKKGFGNLNGLKKLLDENLRARTFEELKIPLFITATDLNNGKSVYFNKGEIKDVVLASSSIPVIFSPIEIDNISYADGGIMNNFPVEPIINITKKLIGVYVTSIEYADEFKNLFNIALRSFHLGIAANVHAKSQKMNLYIEPKGIGKFKVLDVSKGKEIFDLGYNETIKVLKDSNFKF
ncbi:MAG: patatin-like phospholipase family protein [Bacteroidales bacterium]|nr:patatin-like phospholipase family protein [Bacteroidales bacterium]